MYIIVNTIIRFELFIQKLVANKLINSIVIFVN